MEFGLELQKRCAVFQLDKVAEAQPEAELVMQCKYDECRITPTVCIDGITKIVGGHCSTLNHGSPYSADFGLPHADSL